ncbi:hypothetical protein [Burkholderia plantarii]|uniref:hypothetical protein n=1 Tax=Burkholderia plantarii TaxID=41899 RepID=UPI0018DB1E37|nr:hypothetical protein [Burkholderia plantarii]MBI0329159.1 hypothetical protein [Burkholderia plantarii]
MKKAWLVPLVVVLTSGCASDTWIYPVFNASDQRALVKDGARSAAVPLTVDDSRNLVIGLAQKLDAASRHRDDGKLVLRELLFYGTLLAAGGVAAGSIAVRNIGGVIAGGSVTLDSHYQPSVQSRAFANAATMMRCAQDRLDPIDPALIDVLGPALTSDVTPEVRSAYADIPAQVRDYVKRVGLNLQAELAAVQLATPSRQEIATALQAASQAEVTAKDTAADLANKVRNTVLHRVPPAVLEDLEKARRSIDGVQKNIATLAGSSAPQGASAATAGSMPATLMETMTTDSRAAASAVAAVAGSVGSQWIVDCQFNGHALDEVVEGEVGAADMRRYRSCQIQRETAAEQGEMAVAFMEATTKLSSGLELCAKSIH